MFLVPSNKRNRGLVDNFMDDFFSDSFMPAFFGGDAQIKVDIKENEKEYLVEADLPGVKKEEINIDYNNGNLTISVARNEEVNVERENFIRRERRSGSYSRSFYVENVVEDNITARFENGVLSMVLPKNDEGTARKNKIEIE